MEHVFTYKGIEYTINLQDGTGESDASLITSVDPVNQITVERSVKGFFPNMIARELLVEWVERERYPSGNEIANTTKRGFILDKRASEWDYLKSVFASLDFLDLQRMCVNSIIKQITASGNPSSIIRDNTPATDGTPVYMENGDFVQPISLDAPTIEERVLTVNVSESDPGQTMMYSIDKQNYQASPDFDVEEGAEYDIRVIYPNAVVRTVGGTPIPMMSFETITGVVPIAE